jgi:hypothetical protein
MRHAADFAERDHIDNEGDNEEPRLAGDREQNARAQNHAHQQINKNRQSKFHYGDYKIFVRRRKSFKPVRADIVVEMGIGKFKAPSGAKSSDNVAPTGLDWFWDWDSTKKPRLRR